MSDCFFCSQVHLVKAYLSLIYILGTFPWWSLIRCILRYLYVTLFKSLVKLLVYQRESWLAHTYLKGTKRTLIYFQQYSWFIVFPTIGWNGWTYFISTGIRLWGQELRDNIKKQQDLEREERVAQREYERETREAERLRLEAKQKDKDREAAQRAKELELD